VNNEAIARAGLQYQRIIIIIIIITGLCKGRDAFPLFKADEDRLIITCMTFTRDSEVMTSSSDIRISLGA
jgi:hypothetical protein